MILIDNIASRVIGVGWWRDFNETCHKYIMWVGIAEKVFRVVMSKVKVIYVQMYERYGRGGIHFNDVASTLDY